MRNFILLLKESLLPTSRSAPSTRFSVPRPTGTGALDGGSLTIRDKEFFTLLGPSGCGKTSLLRMLRGLRNADTRRDPSARAKHGRVAAARQAGEHGLPELRAVSASHRDDPISYFKLDHYDYLRLGGIVKTLNKPTLFMMENGYAVAEIGINAVNVLSGFLGG
ncbi:ATP-binding cassette domain-containing protein [Acidocella aromatica]|uniref:Energy-coupling factor transporter ATP-binding protein EcfA2 n=1 Tax=Acidocella aromatica TaxID=1303579 RepID=A0A840VBS9_9PROT|nr:energy-coupling factor transporter ATP-binding protein EcfA2 [Acidocella aromatica]